MRWLSRLCLLVWLLLLVLGSVLPRVPPAEAVVRFPGAAYAAHAFAYAVLSVLLVTALLLRSRGAVGLAAVTAVMLGFVLECIQPLTGRTFDLADMAANAGGVAVGLGAVLLARRTACRSKAAGG